MSTSGRLASMVGSTDDTVRSLTATASGVLDVGTEQSFFVVGGTGVTLSATNTITASELIPGRRITLVFTGNVAVVTVTPNTATSQTGKVLSRLNATKSPHIGSALELVQLNNGGWLVVSSDFQ